jgi:hypothetical protein
MLVKELYESPVKERNLDKYGELSDQCICCGKPMKSGESLFVHMNSDWMAVAPHITEETCVEITGADSQGLYPIGNDCAKKMVGFTVKHSFQEYIPKSN